RIFSLLRLTVCLTCFRLTMSLKFLDQSAALFQQSFHDSRGVSPRLLNFTLKVTLEGRGFKPVVFGKNDKNSKKYIALYF
ncbi:MAG: hypothetical protein QNJ63_09355, partial [Calothrix sp. MO_192.B10]|nr:hypothetical protein [Calothrix sp. MO_192.B10]